tara:strand:+ start:667 stop:1491 length:825 start_codon:yes stop_codon:yes gene_type:complete
MPFGSGRFGLSGTRDLLIPPDIGADPSYIFHASSWNTASNQWDDHLGNSVTQIVDGTPTYVAAVTDVPYSGGTAVTLPAVRFDGTDDGWEISQIQINAGNQSTFWISRWGDGVSDSNAAGEGSPIRAYNSGGKTSHFGHQGHGDGVTRVMNTNITPDENENGNTASTLSSAANGGNWYVHGFRSSSSNQAEAAYIIRARNAIGGGTLNTQITKQDVNSGDSGFTGPMTINKGSERNGYSHSPVDINGIWQYNTSLSDTQISDIVLYLGNLVGLN